MAFNTIYDVIKAIFNGSNAINVVATSPLVGSGAFDAIVFSATSTSDVFAYKAGGISGTLVSTVTINYSDASKSTILNVVKT